MHDRTTPPQRSTRIFEAIRSARIIAFPADDKAVCQVLSRNPATARPLPCVAAGCLIVGLLAIGSQAATAAPDDYPADQPATTYFLQDARVVVTPGQQVDKASVLLRRGRIEAVGADLVPPLGVEIVPCAGLTVYAGFIDAANTALLDSEAKLPVMDGRTVDTSRQALAGLRPDDHAGLTPQFLAASAWRPAGNELDKHRATGFCTVHLTPSGRIVSGQSALCQLNGLPVRESQLAITPLVTMRLYERRGSEYPSTLMGVHAHLRQTFLDAERWSRQQALYRDGLGGVDRPADDPVWEVFHQLQRGDRRVLMEVDTPDDIERALRFADEQRLKPVLWGAAQPQRWVDAIQRRRIPVIATLDFGDAPKSDPPKSTDEFAEIPAPQSVRDWRKQRWEDRVRQLAKWDAAGIPFAVSSSGLKSPENVLKSLRQAVGLGLSKDKALAALTTQPAALLGVDRDLGRVAPGLLGNLVVMTGPWDHEQAKPRYVFVEGRKFEYHRDAKPLPADSAVPPITVDVAGTWHVEIEAGDAKLLATLDLQQTTTQLSGRFSSSQGDGLVTSGQASAKDAKWEVSIGAGDRSLVLKFEAVRDGDRLQGTLKSPFGPPAKWTARRDIQPVAAPNPIQLTSVEAVADTPPVSAIESLKSPVLVPVEFPEDRTRRKLKTNGNVLIRNGTVLTGTGVTLPQQSVLIRQGVIAAIGPDLQPDAEMTVIDAAGQFVMPGIIDTHSHIMISNGLGGVNEATHSIVCEVRVNDVINTADANEYRALAGGVTTIRLLHGSANVIGGQDAVVQLKHGGSAAEHLFPGAHGGVKFALGENVKFRQGRFPNTRLGVEATLQRAFVEALDYRRQWQEYDRKVQLAGGKAVGLLPPRRDLRLEALAQILSQEKFIHSHCYRSDEILMLLRVASNHGIRVWSLQHVLEGYKVAPEILAHGASCSTFADWWAYKVEAYDAIPHNAALLYEAGVNAVLKSDDAELMRHMYQEAAKPVRYGNFPGERALSLVTLHAAKELGLADKIGSLEVGKQGDVAIFSGHPLDTFARCEMTMIAGEPYFVRKDQPSVMSTAAAEHSAHPAPLFLPPASERRPPINWAGITDKFALVGGAVHPVDRPSIARGTVLVDRGRITGVTEENAAPDGYAAVHVEGLHVFPGLIDAGTQVGLTEIGKVVETHDFAETGSFQPDLRAGVAINPDSELIPVTRAGGVTAALIRPTGGVMSGQASVMQTAGWTAPDMVLVDAAGLQINWPSARDRKEQFEQLRSWLHAAKDYDAARSAGGNDRLADPRYEALRPYVRGEKPVFIEAESEQHLAEALQFAQQEKLKIILCGATDAWKVADRIKKQNIPVIVGQVMRKPIEEYDPFDAPYANPGRLHEAGVAFCIRSNNPANSRNVAFEAGMAVAYGLPPEVGLRSVTLSAAEVLGIADRCGSITTGKRADLVILDGSPLQVTSQIKGVVVGGKPFAPESRQTQLHEKYRRRLHEMQAPPPTTH